MDYKQIARINKFLKKQGKAEIVSGETYDEIMLDFLSAVLDELEELSNKVNKIKK